MLAIWRARRHVLQRPASILTRDARSRRILEDPFGTRWHIPNQPMIKHAVRTETAWHVRILHDQRQSFGPGRHFQKIKRRIEAISVACIFSRDYSFVFK